jgi:uncharacterized membrane protein YraQ (UPF0718 family)
MKKTNFKDKILAILMVLGTYFVYYFLFNTDVLNAVTFRKNGMTISFIGIFILFATPFFVIYIIQVIRKYIDKRKGSGKNEVIDEVI